MRIYEARSANETIPVGNEKPANNYRILLQLGISFVSGQQRNMAFNSMKDAVTLIVRKYRSRLTFRHKTTCAPQDPNSFYIKGLHILSIEPNGNRTIGRTWKPFLLLINFGVIVGRCKSHSVFDRL